MARTTNTTDSLELLLDTICNTFGGILFIALLVVILLQLAGDGTPSAAKTSTVSPVEFAELQREMQSLHAELQQLREVRQVQERQLAVFAPDELQDLAADRSAAQTRRDQLLTQREQALHALAETAGDLVELRSELDQRRDDLAAARARVGDLQQELERGRARRTQELRTPIVTAEASRREVAVVVQYGRLYLVHAYGSTGFRSGPNLDDFIVLREEVGGIRVTPNPVAGVPLDDSPECREAVLARLRRFPAQAYYIAVVVRPDSYGDFRWLREALQAAGYSYRLMPTDAGDPIVDRGGSGGYVQ